MYQERSGRSDMEQNRISREQSGKENGYEGNTYKENIYKESRQALQEKKLHGEPGFPMVVYHNDFTQYVSEQIPWHWHGELEFVVVTEGCAEFSVGADIFLLKQGEGIFINRDILHHMEPRGERPAYMFSVLLHPGLLEAGQGALLAAKYVTPYLTPDIPYAFLQPETETGQRCLEKLRQIYQVYQEKAFGYEYALHNLICEVWLYLVRENWGETEQSKKTRSASEERIYQALSYIQQHFARQITLEEICGMLHVSKSECCRCFRQKLRMTPFAYIMTYRVNEAAQRLAESTDSVTEIAQQCGFGSDSYFCKQFRRYMGCTPLEYRRRMQSSAWE